MTENAGVDPRTAAAARDADREAVQDATGAPDHTQLAEDPTGEAGAYGGIADDGIAEPDELH